MDRPRLRAKSVLREVVPWALTILVVFGFLEGAKSVDPRLAWIVAALVLVIILVRIVILSRERK